MMPRIVGKRLRIILGGALLRIFMELTDSPFERAGPAKIFPAMETFCFVEGRPRLVPFLPNEEEGLGLLRIEEEIPKAQRPSRR